MVKLKILFLVMSLGLVGCGQEFRTLDNLGTQEDYSDLSIGEDFEAPEDETKQEVIEEPQPPAEEPLPDKPFENSFFFEQQSFNLAHNSALRWDGCEANYQSNGGYNSDTRCGRAFIEQLFAYNLNEVFFACVHQSALAAGYPKPRRVFINHLGSYNDRRARNSTRLSNHAYARALDIKHFILIDDSGKRHRVSTLLRDYVGQQARFYDAFRDCWRESLPTSCRPGSSEYLGSIGHGSSKLGGNSLHNDHIHLSFPLCAGSL